MGEGEPSSTGPSVLRHVEQTLAAARTGLDSEQLATGDSHLKALTGDDPAAAFARIGHLTSDEERFERGLQTLLDGLEAWVEESRAGVPGSGS